MKRYPSDDELELWIRNLEQEELYAPPHLKEEILKKIPQTEKENLSFSFLLYTAKMVAGMAAAIILIFFHPFGDRMEVSTAQIRMEQTLEESQKQKEQLEESLIPHESLEKKIGERMKQTRQELMQGSDWIMSEMKNFWNGKTGGSKE